MPVRPRPTAELVRRATVLAAGAASLACARRGPAPVPVPAERPPAAPAPPGPPAPTAAPPAANPGSGPSVAFRYGSGTYRYAVATNTFVQLATALTVETDTVATRAYVTYVLGGGSAGQTVGGAVDSVVVTSRRGVGGSEAVTTAVPFTGTLTGTGVRLAADSAPPTRCTARQPEALLAVVRDLLVALPPALAQGATWRDSSVLTTCRGNVPTTVSTVHDYRVAAVADSGGQRTLTVERASRSTIAGQGSGGSAGTSLVGAGTAQGRFTYDAGAGRYTGGVVTSAADLTVTTAGQAQRLAQRGASRVTLLSPPP